MAKNITELREALIQSRSGQTRWRCPPPLREEILEYAHQRRDAGISVERVAKELGVSPTGLSRWLKAGRPKLRPVRVAEFSPAVISSPLVLVTPDGYRLEGLTAASAAELLRRLAC